MRHEEIAHDVLEDYDFDIVVLITVDKDRRLQISAADTSSQNDDLTVGILRRVVEAIKTLVGKDKDNPTIH